MNKLFLMLIRHIADRLELCVVDYQNGGFLPREKRALQPIAQKKIGKLAEKMVLVTRYINLFFLCIAGEEDSVQPV